ncbi:MAG: hypothetical protein M3Y86_05990, partial [Verrucomicrobiota bacterium]|nr:hypothetical protein [Verrucomicrobiota bacterium]
LEELPALIAAELKAAAAREGKDITAIHPEAMARLLAHEWRGNLRELSHTVRTMTLFCEGEVILPEHVIFSPDLPFSAAPTTAAPATEAAPDTHRMHDAADLSLSAALRRHTWFVYERSNHNQRLAAKLLGISRSTLARYLRDMSHDGAAGPDSLPPEALNETSVAAVSA